MFWIPKHGQAGKWTRRTLSKTSGYSETEVNRNRSNNPELQVHAIVKLRSYDVKNDTLDFHNSDETTLD